MKMRLRRIFAGMTAGLMVLSMGITALAETNVDVQTVTGDVQTVTVEQQMLASSVKKKTMVVGGMTNYSLKGAKPGDIKVTYSKKGIISISCSSKGKISVTAKKAGTTKATVKTKDGKVLGTFKFTVKPYKDTVIDDLVDMMSADYDTATASVYAIAYDDDISNPLFSTTLSLSVDKYADDVSSIRIDLGLPGVDAFGLFSVFITPAGDVYFDVDSTKSALAAIVEGVPEYAAQIGEYLRYLNAFDTKFVKLSTSDVLDFTSDMIKELTSQGTITEENATSFVELMTATKSALNGDYSGITSMLGGNSALLTLDTATKNQILDILVKSLSSRLQLTGASLTGTGVMEDVSQTTSLAFNSKIGLNTLAKTWNTWLSSDAPLAVKKIKAILKKAGVSSSILNSIKLSDYKLPANLGDIADSYGVNTEVDVSVTHYYDESNSSLVHADACLAVPSGDAYTNVNVGFYSLASTMNHGDTPLLTDATDLMTLDAFKSALKGIITDAVKDSPSLGW